jgi:hypothetical protein
MTPPNFPAKIPVALEPFMNWSRMIDVPQIWTCVPASEADVVSVCNWAAQEGYSVRARGMMHTWSPLTVTQGEPTGKFLLVDLTQHLNQVVGVTAATGNAPAQVIVQTGATMEALMLALEQSLGGAGSASGFSFAHIPAPGNITVGGALAINAHGTAVPTPPDDDFDVPYGSLSNQILAFTAVVTPPGSGVYTLRTFARGDADAKAFLTHCGRALIIDVTLQVTDNYNLRCQSFMNIPATTLFAAPTGGKPPPGSVGAYFAASGRVEVIWFPTYPFFGVQPTSYPWLKVWTVVASKPATSKAVSAPYNYPFSDDLPDSVTDILSSVVAGEGWLTPIFTAAFATYTASALSGGFGFGDATDLWGPSKNTMLYVKDETLRVTANGYAILMKRDQVQQALSDFTEQFIAMLGTYQSNGYWPINSPLEIRVTGLDDPARVRVPAGQVATSPVVSSLSVDPVVVANGWDVACWFDVLTVVPAGDPQHAYPFYADFEAWCANRFGSGFRVSPEWSKGWAYTSAGAWTDQVALDAIRATFTKGRAADDTWSWEVATLADYDSGGLFVNEFLQELFKV